MNRYALDENGSVYSYKAKRFLKPCLNERYMVIRLAERNWYLHRLIALTFIPNPSNLPQVNHINGVRTDNRIENLEWCTARENVVHSHKTGLAKHSPMTPSGKKNASEKRFKKVIDNETGHIYASLSEASKITGIKLSTLSVNARGLNQKEYRFSYILVSKIEGGLLVEKQTA